MNKIKSIDGAKGISILFIILLNSINYWLIIDENSKYIFAYIVIFCEIFGLMLFIFSYSFETIFILQKIMGSPPERKYKNKVLRRGLIFLILGLVYNLIFNLFDGFTFRIWGWNIILYLAFAQIIIYFSFKLLRWTRFAIGLAILFFTGLLRELLYFSREGNILLESLYLFIVSPDPSFSLLPYASFCFFASVFSELIYQAKVLESLEALKVSIKSTIRYGVTFMIAGFIITIRDFDPLVTSAIYNPLKYPFIDGSSILRNFDFQHIPNMPEFLLKGTAAYILFTLGVLIITIGLIFYFSKISMKTSKVSNGLRFYGRNSLTIIFIQYVFLPLFLYQVSIVLFFPLTCLLIVLLGYLMFIWKKYANGKFSIEWIIKKGTVTK